MVHFNTIRLIHCTLETHVFARLTSRPGQTKSEVERAKYAARMLSLNPVVETADDGTDFLWFWIDGGELGCFRLGFNTSSLFPSNLKCIQKLNPVSDKWQNFWKETE